MKNYLKRYWRYCRDAAIDGRAISAFLATLAWLLIIAAFSSFFLTPKPWIVQFSNAVLGIAGGGIAGAILGLLLGGIGIALAGTAIGIAGWIAGALFGAGLGSMFGLLVSFFSTPNAFTFHFWKFAVVALGALLVAALVYLGFLKIYRILKNKLQKRISRQEV